MQTKIINSYNTNLLRKILYWADQHQYFCYFNPNDYEDNYGGFRHFLAIGNDRCLGFNTSSLDNLKEAVQHTKDTWVGYFSYDLKKALGYQNCIKPQTIHAEEFFFFKAETIISFDNGTIKLETINDPNDIWNKIQSTNDQATHEQHDIKLRARTSKEKYLQNCEKIKKDIVDGEYYEINYCIEFFAENAEINPIEKYLTLNALSPMPFSCLGKFGANYVISASPERFLKKTGIKIISQPIKGTIKRGKDEREDDKLKTILRNSQKELAENMMIIDLVRNDLNINAKTGTVKVEEFFGIYTFKQIHQMISTISCKIPSDTDKLKVITDAFPMGSMTGAPKKRVVTAIDDYEDSCRGIYSGAIGYFTPDGDFDFNVVIRSIIYNSTQKKLSFHVGSAITYDADPEYEYEECLLKANSMMSILS